MRISIIKILLIIEFFIFLLLNFKNKKYYILNSSNILVNKTIIYKNLSNKNINIINKKKLSILSNIQNISKNKIIQKLTDNNFTFENLINNLLINFNKTLQKNIIISDFFPSKYCADINAYYIFKYYQHKNITYSYYIINIESEFYKSLLSKNETKNLILFNSSENFWEILYEYLLHTKIIVQSYTILEFQILANKLPFLKYLKINHGVRYFKKNIGLLEFKNLNIIKRNIITSSPLEYELFKNYFNYSDNYIHKAGIARYDRFKNIKKNESERNCILISFTYRNFNNIIFSKSLYKKNIKRLLNDIKLISFLNSKKIDLIYINHHQDFNMNRSLNLNEFPYIKYKGQTSLSHYIEQCSLLVTDFSSIAFDFIFQNKPTLFYLIDVNDSLNFEEKQYMQNFQNKIYFDNVFIDQKKLVEKIILYTKKNFKISYELYKKYQNVFYFKNNITEKIIDVINDIIKK